MPISNQEITKKGIATLTLVKGITCYYPKNKGIHHHGEHYKTKDGESYKIISHD